MADWFSKHSKVSWLRHGSLTDKALIVTNVHIICPLSTDKSSSYLLRLCLSLRHQDDLNTILSVLQNLSSSLYYTLYRMK